MAKPDMIMLDGTNYRTWKGKMEDLLYVKELADPIENEGKMPEIYQEKEAEGKKLDRKAVGFIRQWIGNTVIHHIEEATTAYALWSKLDSLYANKNAVNKVHLIGKLFNLKFSDGKSVAAHLNEFQSIFIQLKNMEISFGDEVQALLVLGSLPSSWETLQISLSNSAPGGKLSMATVQAALLGEEIRRGDDQSSASTSKSEALMTEGRGRTKSGKQNNHRGKSRGKSKDYMKNKPCHNCGKFGHWRNECTEPKKKGGKQKSKTQQAQPETDILTSEEELVIVSETVGACIGTTFKEGEWVIDSGASFHVTPHREFFSSYTAGDYGEVRMGNKDTAKVVGRGDIQLQIGTGCNLLLKEVRHFPDLRLSLISTGQLDDDGYVNTFGNNTWKLTKGSLVVAKGRKDCSLYRTQTKLSAAQLNAVERSFEVWHQRLGHMSEKGMKILCKKEYIPDLHDGPIEKCIDCLMGKQHRVSFSRESTRAAGRLDRVHSDVCGPLKEIFQLRFEVTQTESCFTPVTVTGVKYFSLRPSSPSCNSTAVSNSRQCDRHLTDSTEDKILDVGI